MPARVSARDVGGQRFRSREVGCRGVIGIVARGEVEVGLDVLVGHEDARVEDGHLDRGVAGRVERRPCRRKADGVEVALASGGGVGVVGKGRDRVRRRIEPRVRVGREHIGARLEGGSDACDRVHVGDVEKVDDTAIGIVEAILDTSTKVGDDLIGDIGRHVGLEGDDDLAGDRIVGLALILEDGRAFLRRERGPLGVRHRSGCLVRRVSCDLGGIREVILSRLAARVARGGTASKYQACHGNRQGETDDSDDPGLLHRVPPRTPQQAFNRPRNEEETLPTHLPGRHPPTNRSSIMTHCSNRTIDAGRSAGRWTGYRRSCCEIRRWGTRTEEGRTPRRTSSPVFPYVLGPTSRGRTPREREASSRTRG